MKEVEQFLLDRAMEHDSPALLFNLATEFLISAKTIRPGVSILERMITSARTGATALTSYLRQFTPGVLAAVDFTGGPGTADLMAAVAILKSLNASGGRKVAVTWTAIGNFGDEGVLAARRRSAGARPLFDPGYGPQ
jgi:Domain of unknown function (DUF4158)